MKLLPTLSLCTLLSLSSVIHAQTHDPRAPKPLPKPPSRYAILLFPAFQALDVFGPLDILNSIAFFSSPLNLSLIAPTLDPVSTQPRMPTALSHNFSESVVPTHTFAHPPSDIEVLIVPGGAGTRAPAPELDAHVAYIKSVYPKLRYLISVCTGVGLVARTGVLEGHRATGNKRAWAWVMAQGGRRTYWVPHARWVRSGNIWTTSGIAAGMDGVFDFVRVVYGEEVAKSTADALEYVREMDWTNDPFAALYNLTESDGGFGHGTF
ncbi:class I glutamine amidotransferase-like protein [Crassisporium funariophilum]|nr:class I glutamine amidotransferase-like protein [Crassisporium funariophilum]